MRSSKNNWSRNWMAYCALILSGSLFAVSVVPVNAVEHLLYEQYQSGELSGRVYEGDYETVTISTEAELVELAENCRLDSWSANKYVKLENDIVLQENSGLMIPVFGGIFEGGGHQISGVEIRDSGAVMGLFRYVQAKGRIRNLSVSGTVSPEGSESQVGLLAGVNYGTIINCSVSGVVTGDEEVGGIAGINEVSGAIRNSSSSALVTGAHYTGGICGANRGTLNNCSNYGNVNIYSQEVTYDIEDITVENLEDINSAGNVSAHTDTGGITGYSEGKIYYCLNSGNVGYQHVGYNTGGIVGRLHQGYVQNCTNTGHVLGRKDVGGIAGQMEPFLEVQYLDDKLKEIDRETGKFLDLLEKTQQELSADMKQAAELTRLISESLNSAADAAGELLGTANDLWYIYNQELGGINSDLNRLVKDLGEAGDSEETSQNVTVSGADWGDGTVSGGNILRPGDITIQIPDNTAAYRAALKRFGESTSEHLGNITSATDERSEGVANNLDTLNRELESAGDNLTLLSELLVSGTDKTSANMDALHEQAEVLRKSINELRDDLFRYEGISVSDTSDEEASGELSNLGAAPMENEPTGEAAAPEKADVDEEAYYDTSSFQQGKITLCINRGLVEADTNLGGIVGQVAIEYDFDPEDDISFTGAESFNLEQTVKAVIRESRNLGNVIGKKDYVGGVVGKADFGAVISCESYGNVSSTSGSYVGGIVGSSSYAVRSCYSMGNLSGKNYVGGIVGKGCDVFYSYTYPTLSFTGEYAGAVAGQLDKAGTLNGNYYVKGEIAGIDRIDYGGGAEALSYEEFCDREGLPEAFYEFTVSFCADGKELAAIPCRYGDAIERSQIPEIPAKEGYYGVWEDFDFDFVTGSRILDARYEKWISSLASSEKNENGRAMVLVQGAFLPDARLKLQETPAGTELTVVSVDEAGNVTGGLDGEVIVRARCEDAEHAVVEIFDGSGYKQAESAVMNHYVEFSMELPGTFRLTVKEDDNRKKMIVAATVLGGTLVLSLLIRLIVKNVKKGRKRASEGEAEAVSCKAEIVPKE